MQKSKTNYFQRRTKFQGPKINDRIRSLDVQVINSNGENLGVLPLKKAIDAAKEEGLDLIEISPNANPPVCKIIDIGNVNFENVVIEVGSMEGHIITAEDGLRSGELEIVRVAVRSNELFDFQLSLLLGPILWVVRRWVHAEFFGFQGMCGPGGRGSRVCSLPL